MATKIRWQLLKEAGTVSFDRLLDIYFFVSFFFVLIAAPPYFVWRRRTRGQLLYHLPRSRFYRGLLVFFVVVSTLGILAQITSMANASGPSLLELSPTLFGLTCGLFALFPTNRFEIREAGIYLQKRFIKWKDIYTFQWKEEGDYKLGLGAEAYILGLNVPGDSFPWWLEWYKFQPDQREDIDKLLSQYLPKAA